MTVLYLYGNFNYLINEPTFTQSSQSTPQRGYNLLWYLVGPRQDGPRPPHVFLPKKMCRTSEHECDFFVVDPFRTTFGSKSASPWQQSSQNSRVISSRTRFPATSGARCSGIRAVLVRFRYSRCCPPKSQAAVRSIA